MKRHGLHRPDRCCVWCHAQALSGPAVQLPPRHRVLTQRARVAIRVALVKAGV